VRAEAALQGYSSDDIFVTGHSLGGWQAQYVAQQTGLAGIGFEAPGINTTVPGNGADSMFVNIGSYGSPATYMATDLPGLQPFMPAYAAGGGSKPHYGPIIMLGDPSAMTPLYNASQLWGHSVLGSAIFLLDFLNNLGQFHMVGVQAHSLDIAVDPGVVSWLGTKQGDVRTGYGELTIPELLRAASDDGILLAP
jgi:pimeloyl-ACP methyl ester carboxylesterase